MTTQDTKDQQRVCEGSCDTHRGPVVLVHVVDEDTGFDWGKFWYCEEAIQIDRDGGLHVNALEIA